MWRKWAAIQLTQTVRNLGLTKDKTLFVIGRRSFLTPKKEEIRDLSNQELKLLRKEVDIHQLDINNLMISTLDKNVFINVHEIVCGASSSCPVFTDNLKMISLDGGHLSKDGARYLGRILFNKSQLSALINPG